MMTAKVRVLIADNSDKMRRIFKELLLNNGYEVAGEAVNGAEAVDLYERLLPDVVAMDVSMPEMDGVEALKRIKAAFPQAKVVMLSSMRQQNKVIEAMRAGADEFIIKPVQEEAAAAALGKVLK